MLHYSTGGRLPNYYGENGDESQEGSDGESWAVTLEKERAAKHAEYLSKRSSNVSLVGTYIVDCKQIEKGWDNTDNLELVITTTSLPGIYQATFDFGILEGVMMLCADEYVLSYFSEKEFPPRNSPSSLPVENGDEEGDDVRPTGSKRKSSREDTRPSKAPKISSSASSTATTLHLCMRSRDTGSGEINWGPDLGTVVPNSDFTVLTGMADMVCVGDNVPFRARKISDEAEKPSTKWEDYTSQW